MESPKPLWVPLLAVIALIICLYIGWFDFTFHVPRVEVQEAIRSAPRRIIQFVMQFVLPILLLRFIVSQAIKRWRTH